MHTHTDSPRHVVIAGACLAQRRWNRQRGCHALPAGHHLQGFQRSGNFVACESEVTVFALSFDVNQSAIAESHQVAACA